VLELSDFENLAIGDLVQVTYEANDVWEGVGMVDSNRHKDHLLVDLTMRTGRRAGQQGSFGPDYLEIHHKVANCPKCEADHTLQGDYLCHQCRYG
jgi:hypothetical protein